MVKVLTILHIFYHEQTDYFIEKLSNINSCQWDLLVTYTTYNQQTIDKIRKFKPDAVIMKSDNIGYDVWPFIQALKSIDIDSYDYILKLHTKNTANKKKIRLNGQKLTNRKWGDLLVNSMLKSPEQFRKCLDIMDNNPKAGLVCSLELFVGLTQRRAEDMSLLEYEAKRIGMKTRSGKFCAGTMFMIRPQCLKKIIEADFDPSQWEQRPSHSGGTLAHVYERIFCIAVLDAGYRCRTIAAYPLNIPRVFIHKHISPYMKQIFTMDRYGEDRRKCVVILGKRIMLSDSK